METIQITKEEKSALIRWLNIELRDPNRIMTQQYANTLHSLFVKLTGKNHDVWKRRGGKYYK